MNQIMGANQIKFNSQSNLSVIFLMLFITTGRIGGAETKLQITVGF